MKILFIAEASSGNNKSFYKGNTLLFRTVKEALEETYGPFADQAAFFSFFNNAGFGVEHLCIKTISRESAAIRAAARKRCIPSLAARIKAERPLLIIILMTNISDEVHEAVALSAADTVRMIRTTPYPAVSEKNRLECISGIRAALKEAAAAGIGI